MTRGIGFLCAAALSVVLAGPVSALSCARPDVARIFERLHAAEEIYIAVHGVLSFDEALLPETDWERQHETPPSTVVPARLTGQSLSREGFSTPFDAEIRMDVQCAGPWCARIPSETEVLAFVERNPLGYRFVLGPCSSFGLIEPDAKSLNTALSCLRGDACTPLQ